MRRALATSWYMEGVVSGCGVDHPFHFVLQVQRGGGLATTFQQLTEFSAQGCHFTLMGLQFAVAVLVKHGQRVDRAIER